MNDCCEANKIYDHHEGIDVCKTCGRVLSDLVLEHTTQVNNKIHKISNIHHDYLNTLEIICENHHIPRNIEEYTIYLISTEKKKLCLPIIAAHLYFSCHKFNASRTIKEISSMFKLNPPSIKEFCSLNILPSEITERVCMKLGNASFSIIKRIKYVSDYFYNHILLSSPPQSALGITLCIFASNFIPALKIEDIAASCELSLSCLRRLCRIYKSDLCELQSYEDLLQLR